MPAPFVENAVFFPLDGFSSLVKDQVTIGVWVHLWVFNSVPLVYLSVTIPVPCSFYHNCSVVNFRSGMVIPPVVPAPFVENAVFFPLDGFCSLVKDQVTIGVWVHFWVFNSIPLVYLSVAIPVPCSFCHNCSVVKL